MDALHEMFLYHVWATRTLIEHCATVPHKRLHDSIPGTFGAIHPTLVHIISADQRYLERLDGEPRDPSLSEDSHPSLEALGAHAEASSPRWLRVLARLPELDVTLPPRDDRPAWPHAETLLVLQAIHHGNDHRTQVCSTLGALGLEVPAIDGWAYWMGNRV